MDFAIEPLAATIIYLDSSPGWVSIAAPKKVAISMPLRAKRAITKYQE